MGYCTEEEVRESKYADSLDNIAGTGAVGTEIIEAAIKYADGRIDFYCSNQYSVPFSPVPDYINGASILLSVLWLYRRSDRKNISIEEAADELIEELKMIQEGTAQVPGVNKSTGDVSFYSPFQKSIFGNGVFDNGNQD